MMKTIDQVEQAIDYKSQTAYPTYRMKTVDQVKQAIDYMVSNSISNL